MVLGMISSSQIKEHLAEYIAKQISLEELEDWFVPNSRDIRRSQSEAAKFVTFAVEGALTEFLTGIYDEYELRDEFSKIVSADTTSFEFRDATINTPIITWSTASRMVPVFARL